MTEIRFYHAQRSSLEQVLPPILGKALSGGRRVVVRLGDATLVETINNHLWSFSPDSFLPHGAAKDGQAAQQPVWLTDQDENPNQADVLIRVPGTAQDVPAHLADFTLCCDVIDGRLDEEVMAARERWKLYKAAGYQVTYWQQTDKGWEQKA
ncbi:MAG: DNA polymerase III subunit chi [Alphaproteobacteria bacterium]|nr:DNA polymerase III subunit chi [Alphaproteobacteria bacterium]